MRRNLVEMSKPKAMPFPGGMVPESGRHPVFWLRADTGPASAGLASILVQPGASARAIVSQIRSCAERLVAQGESSSIDLRFLKSMPEERAILAKLLGRGEVSAVVAAIGRSEIQETAIPCVWWLRHLNGDSETVGESIEVTDIPELLVGDRSAVAVGLEALSAGSSAGA